MISLCGLRLCVVSFFLFFFFSSRRRHTRLVSDWSSDVCSSDLAVQVEVDDARRDRLRPVLGRVLEDGSAREPEQEGGRERSEERRVGKEGRDGGRAGQQKEERGGERRSYEDTRRSCDAMRVVQD